MGHRARGRGGRADRRSRRCARPPARDALALEGVTAHEARRDTRCAHGDAGRAHRLALRVRRHAAVRLGLPAGERRGLRQRHRRRRGPALDPRDRGPVEPRSVARVPLHALRAGDPRGRGERGGRGHPRAIARRHRDDQLGCRRWARRARRRARRADHRRSRSTRSCCSSSRRWPPRWSATSRRSRSHSSAVSSSA